MRDLVLRHAGSPQQDTAIPRLSLSKVSSPGHGRATVLTPVICVALQGEKQITIGSATFHLGSGHCFVASLETPAAGRIVAASNGDPYLGAGLLLNREMLAELIAQMPAPGPGNAETSGFGTGALTGDLLEAWSGLLALLDRPEDIPALAPLREREVLYRLLRGELGGHLRQFAREDGRLARIRGTIGWIRDHYEHPIRMAALADMAGMSVANFYRHFKTATALTPLQYQKLLRLHSARRHLVKGAGAGQAGYLVGYESASQFSREYRRLFGIPPSLETASRDV